MFQRKTWSKKVGRVFNTMPRDGSDSRTVWLPRRDMERRLSDVLHFPGVHICLDGPTGTGKTSLALTELNRAQLKYVLVQTTEKMDWVEFCKRLATVPSTRESSVSTELDVGLVAGIPQGRFRVSLGTKDRPSDAVELLDKVAKGWSEHDVCQMMTEEETMLFVDDFERANEEILVRVADMCKLLTESYVGPHTKLIIVGTADIYRRLFTANPSLEARLEEISVGTLPGATISWKFLQMGFEALNLTHPANDKLVTREENVECMRAIYDAANGLPKSLNELGRDISLRGIGRNRISPADVKTLADEMPKRNVTLFRGEFPKVMKLVERSPAARAVLHHLYRIGIGQIHAWSEVISSLSPEFPEDQVDNAIREFVQAKFLVQTGQQGDVLFVVNPRLAHTLGVIIEDPLKYGQSPRKYAPMGQLTLPFRVQDPE